MNRLSTAALSAAVSATVAALLSIWLRPPTAVPTAPEARRPLDSGEVPAQLEQLGRALGELEVSLATLGRRVGAVEQVAGRQVREPVVAQDAPALPNDAIELLAALAEGDEAPASIEAWVDQAIDGRRRAEREERRLAFEQSFEQLLSERFDELDELLDLDPYQADEVESILTNQISAVSRALSEAESPLDMMAAMQPIREERDAQLELILTPDQLTTFKEQEPAMGGPRMLFGARPR
ncbi:MAG: hypothetical protein AAFZ65_04640 [Planctomycetota bacterium]